MDIGRSHRLCMRELQVTGRATEKARGLSLLWTYCSMEHQLDEI